MESNPTVVFPEPRRVVIEERGMPSLAAGDLLIRTERTLVSTGTELTILSGEFPAESAWSRYGKYPFLPGYDNIGEVIDVGKDVSGEWLGRRVASYGNHARFVARPATQVRPVPFGIAPDHAVFFTIAEIVMNGVRRGEVTWGEEVVVFGLGLLGQLTVQICHLCGARTIIAVDVSDWRLQRLPQCPGILPVNSSKESLQDIVKSATRGRMADVVFEVTGNAEAVPEEARLLRRLGRLVIVSSPRGPSLFDFHDLCNSPSLTIIGAHNSSHPAYETLNNPWTNHRHAELFFDLVADGRLDVGRLISHRVPYTEAPGVYEQLLEDRSRMMGVLFEW